MSLKDIRDVLGSGFLRFSRLATVVLAMFVVAGDITSGLNAVTGLPILGELWLKLLVGLAGAAGGGLLAFWLEASLRGGRK